MIELDLLGDDEKRLVTLFLLTFLREHCRTTRKKSTIAHLTLVEEAHRVMGHSSGPINRENQGDAAGGSSRLFSAALSELRTFGESLVVVEQIPTRLVEDALKNTTIKIIHRLPGRDDGLAVGNAINLEVDECSHLVTLPAGRAAIFTGNAEYPNFTDIKNYAESVKLPERVEDKEVQSHMESVVSNGDIQDLRFDGDSCRLCHEHWKRDGRCAARDELAFAATDQSFASSVIRIPPPTLGRTEAEDAAARSYFAKYLVVECENALKIGRLPVNHHNIWCLFWQVWKRFGLPMNIEIFKEVETLWTITEQGKSNE